MRDISNLNKTFDEYVKRLEEKLVLAQQRSTEFMYEEVKDRIDIPTEARNISQFIEYNNSLKIKEAKLEGDEITSDVHSDLLVGGDSKWADVHVGAFLEWGTGPLGEETNDYPHGYNYTTMAPWDEHTAIQFYETSTWGIQARPHLYPALMQTREIHRNNIKEAIEEAWMK